MLRYQGAQLSNSAYAVVMPGGLDYFEHEEFKKAQAYPKDMATISKATLAQKKQAYGIKKHLR